MNHLNHLFKVRVDQIPGELTILDGLFQLKFEEIRIRDSTPEITWSQNNTAFYQFLDKEYNIIFDNGDYSKAKNLCQFLF